MKDVIYLLCTVDDGGCLVGDLDCFYTDPAKAVKDAIHANLDIIKREYTDELLLFQPGYNEDSDNYDKHFLNYHDAGDMAFMAAHFAASYLYDYDSFYPYLYAVVPIGKNS